MFILHVSSSGLSSILSLIINRFFDFYKYQNSGLTVNPARFSYDTLPLLRICAENVSVFLISAGGDAMRSAPAGRRLRPPGLSASPGGD